MTVQLLLTSILRKFLCILKIKEFILGVTWRSCGMPSAFNDWLFV